jgi:arginyl-tRNA--protein-N-Asp/Glu arginylyltransferase
MTAFQIQTFIPPDGSFTTTFPEHLRGKKVKLSAEPEKQNEQEEDAFTLICKKLDKKHESGDSTPMSVEEFTEFSSALDEWLANRPKRSKEEYLAWLDSIRGTLQNVDYSDLRDETDREL